jgi:syntaxin 1B/2/3
LEIEFQKQEAQQLERQIRIANPSATSEEIEQAVHNAQTGSRPVFAQQLLGQQYQAQETLQNVSQRHEEIQRLAQSINQLTELFQEMQSLLENQAHVLNTIEASSYEVVNEIEKGNGQLSQAVTLAKNTRRKKWIMFGIVAAIVIILVIVLVVKLVPQNKQ